MLSIIFFAFSLSLDALGYALGFGSRNVKLRFVDFLILNILNVLILSFLFEVYSLIQFSSFVGFLKSFGDYLLLFFGLYYIFLAFKEQFFSKEKKIFFKRSQSSYLTIVDLFLLLSIFFIENIFAVIIFCASFSGKIYFISLIFLFHMFFFLIGFCVGNKVVRNLNLDSSFLSGTIFVVLALINLK
jgi:putative Mn2+ efflux pump MntP